MRFLVVTQYFPPEIGAPATRLMAVTRHLVDAGHQVEVVTSMPNYPAGHIHPNYRGRLYCIDNFEGMSVHRVWSFAAVGTGMGRIANYGSFAVMCLLGLLRAKRPDYVFVESPPLTTVIPGLIASALREAPSILNVADLWPDSIEALGLMRGKFGRLLLRAARTFEAYAYRRSAFVTAVTEGIRSTLLEEKHVPAQKLLYLPNGVDTRLFNESQPDDVLKASLGLSGKHVVVYPGTIGHAHGVQTAIEAATLLASEPSFHFLFIGDGSERRHLAQLAQTRRLTNVSFLDPVPIAELARYLSIALCGLVTLRDDIPLLATARPAKTMAILAAGKPVVFCGGLEFPKLIRENGMGLTTPHNDPTALAAAVRLLARDPDLAARFGRNARAYAATHCDWSALVGSWLKSLGEQHSRRATTLSPVSQEAQA